MADAADLANDIAEERMARLIADQQRRAQRSPVESLYCDECGVVIPLARREAVPGCTTCVDCQRLLEVRRG